MMSGDRYDIPIVRKANREENEEKKKGRYLLNDRVFRAIVGE